jgi:hypothetical protein
VLTIRVDPNGTDRYFYAGEPNNPESTNTIVWNPTSALVLTSGAVQSAAIGLGHETDHAFRDLIDHQQFLEDRHHTNGQLTDDPNQPGGAHF